MHKKESKLQSKTAQELRHLLDADSSEETIHQFFKDSVFRIGLSNPRFSEQFIVGAVSKFPVSPDRIPDFTSAFLNIELSQRPSRISFVELKKPNAALYTGHARMSKDLNDAWMECVETSRLIADNFRDFLRRLVKALDETRFKEFDSVYDKLSKKSLGIDEKERYFLHDSFTPWCNSVIVIGRRLTLDSEGLLRTRELSASTGRAIQVITYDTVLDWLSELDEDDARKPWNLFLRGWYW
jgi:hypothetical protein